MLICSRKFIAGTCRGCVSPLQKPGCWLHKNVTSRCAVCHVGLTETTLLLWETDGRDTCCLRAAVKTLWQGEGKAISIDYLLTVVDYEADRNHSFVLSSCHYCQWRRKMCLHDHMSTVWKNRKEIDKEIVNKDVAWLCVYQISFSKITEIWWNQSALSFWPAGGELHRSCLSWHQGAWPVSKIWNRTVEQITFVLHWKIAPLCWVTVCSYSCPAPPVRALGCHRQWRTAVSSTNYQCKHAANSVCVCACVWEWSLPWISANGSLRLRWQAHFNSICVRLMMLLLRKKKKN